MVIVRCNGTQLVETARGLGLVEQGTDWTGTALLVAAVVTVMATLGGSLTIPQATGAGIALLGLGGLAGATSAALVRRRRRLRSQTTPAAPWLELDLTRRLLVTPRVPAGIPFDQVRLERVFQVGSSSKALAVFCPAKLVIARGTPFGDEVDQLEHELRRRGLGRA